MSVCTYVSLPVPTTSSSWERRGALSGSDRRWRAAWWRQRSRGHSGSRFAFPDTNAFVQTIVQVTGGRWVIAQADLSVSVVSGLRSAASTSTPASASSFTSRFPSTTAPSASLARRLGTGGDLGELAAMGGPQVRLGASTVEEQEVHTGRAALANSCTETGKKKKEEKGEKMFEYALLRTCNSSDVYIIYYHTEPVS